MQLIFTIARMDNFKISGFFIIFFRVISLLLLCHLNLKSYTQNIRFDHLDINNGLSQNSAFCMDIDAYGYLWTGTLNGLNKYDGYEFEIFKPSHIKKGSLKGSLCNDLACDLTGNTWIATKDGGLNKYDGLQQRFIHYNDSLFQKISTKNIQKIQIDKQGWIWLKSAINIVAFNPLDSSEIELPSKLKRLNISLLANGNIAAYGKLGVYELSLKPNLSINANQRIKEPTIAISFSADKTIALHRNYIGQYNNSSFVRTHLFPLKDIKNRIETNLNPALMLDSNNIYIGGKQGLIKCEIKNNQLNCTQYKYDAKNPNSFRGYQISEILKDKADNIWIGTSKHGINFISQRKNIFKHFNWKPSNSSEVEIDLVRAICASSKKDYWLGFDRTGLGIIHENGNQSMINSFLNANGSRQKLKSVRTIFEDKQNNIWVGMLNGICIYNRKTKNLEHINRYFQDKWNSRSYSIKQFSNKKVAISAGSKLGLIDFANKSEELFESRKWKNSIRSNIREIEIDGIFIWIGLDQQGIVKVNTQTKDFIHFNSDSIGLSDSKVYSLRKIGNDLWIATNNGLNRFNTVTNKVDEIFYEEQGLANNIVYSLNYDNENNLWMSTNRGISKLNLLTKRFSTYLKSNFFMDDASFQAMDGSIFYGGYNGVVYFTPEKIHSKNEISSPFIENFTLQNKVVKAGRKINNRILLHQHINQSKEIQLNHLENTFSFDFKAIPFDIPNSNKYRYKLENWQNNWEDGESNSATFTNVLPGKYKFVLSVSSSGENWSPSKEIIITITPPFWQKIWFKLIIIGFIFLFLFIIYRWRVYQFHQRNRLLKQKVDEQTEDIIRKSEEIQKISQKLHESDEAKLRFFTNISHEFRTPLTLILGYLDELDDAKSFTIKKVIKNNALRLLRLVNQLIEFRKLDQDQLQLEVSYFELNSFVEEIVQSFQKLATNKNIRLSFEPNINRIPVWLDMDKTEKILFNLISNAIKYTPENNPVIVSTNANSDYITIKVTDYGIGITDDELPQVFDRFFRSKNSHESGHGIGLALAKGLTEMQYGKLSVSSKKGTGSIFSAQFLTGKNHFKNNELISQKSPQTYLPNRVEDIFTIEKSQNNISQKRILLVEDDPELTNFLQKILSVNFTITCAENGIDALQKLENIIPDLIISDITMPQMDGITLCKKIKESALTAKIPFILLTAKTDSLTRIKGFNLGIDDYIEKPFDKQILIARIEALLGNREKLQLAPIETKTLAKLDKTKFSKSDVQFWKKTNTIINRNFGNPNFTTEVLSEKLNMSRSTFYRKFKGLCGENAADYIRKIRLHKAAELIQEKELNIQQISLEVGFQSTAHFRTKFKDYFGINPSEYA